MTENKNSNIIAFRINPNKKKVIELEAQKNNMNLSEYVKAVMIDHINESMLLDTQKKLTELITQTVKDANEQQFYKLLTLINKNHIGIETIILQNDMAYKYFDLPQTRDELNTHLVSHPITEVAREQVLKDVRTNKTNKDTTLSE